MNRNEGLRSSARLFLPHAALTAIPVLVLGLVLGLNYQSVARHRGLSDGAAQANLVAQTAVEPILIAIRRILLSEIWARNKNLNPT